MILGKGSRESRETIQTGEGGGFSTQCLLVQRIVHAMHCAKPRDEAVLYRVEASQLQ